LFFGFFNEGLPCFLNDLYQYLDQSEFGISSTSSFKEHGGRIKCFGDSRRYFSIYYYDMDLMCKKMKVR